MSSQQMTLQEALQFAVQQHRTGNVAMAQALYQQVLNYEPANHVAQAMLGILAYQAGDMLQAESMLKKALAIQPDYADAWCNLGSVYDEMDNTEEAAKCYQKAITLKPDMAEAYNNYGNLLSEQGKYQDAVNHYLKAIAIEPHYSMAHYNLGNAYKNLDKIGTAISHFRHAVIFQPDHAEAQNNLASALAEVGQLVTSAIHYERAVALKPDYAEAWMNLGALYLEQGEYKKARDCFDRAPHLTPDYATTESNKLFTLHYDPVITQEELHQQAVGWGRKHAPASLRMPAAANDKNPARLLKLGVVSGDLRNHPVGYFLENLLTHLNRSSVTVYGYANQRVEDDLSTRLKQHMSGWSNILNKSDEEVAAQIRADGIDILLDLSGHTGYNRLLTFARKPAPVQATWLGYFDTTGMEAMDYIISDRYVIPAADTHLYTEKPIHLPDSYLCFTPPEYDVPVDTLPYEDNKYITFGSFNKLNKITPSVVVSWAQILRKVPGSKLLLKTRALAEQNMHAKIQQLFALQDINANRLILEAHAPRPELLAAYNRVDIALDPYPYVGGTTSCEALWMGVPVITLSGEHFVSRIGESILHAAGLPDLIAHTEEQYVTIARTLAADTDRLATWRKGLRDQVVTSPLCDGAKFARNFETLLRQMWQHWCEA